MEKWTEEKIKFLKDNYPLKGKVWCAKSLNMSEGQIRSKASDLKIRIDKNSEFFKDFQTRAAKSKIGKKRPEHSKLMKEYSKKGLFPVLTHQRTDEEKAEYSERLKKLIKEKGHPKGMLGKKHTDKVKNMLSDKSKKMWNDKDSFVNSDEYRQHLSDRQSKFMVKKNKELPEKLHSRSVKGWVEIGGKRCFFKSKWESNIASYFEFLKKTGEIIDWQYEPKTYWFESIKRGVRSYTPDFLIIDKNGNQYFEEVKGYMDSKSKTKINRMRIYYPEVDLRVLGKDRYESISKKKNIFKDWGLLG